MKLTCSHCEKEFDRRFVRNTETMFFCHEADCRKAYRRHRSDRWYVNHKVTRTPRVPKERVRKNLPCQNCGDMTMTHSKYGAFCKKEACQLSYQRTCYLATRKLSSRKVADGTFNVMGEAIERDPLKIIVDARERHCGTCRWTAHCRLRVNLGLWVACEPPDEHDLNRLRDSENAPAMLRVLNESLVY